MIEFNRNASHIRLIDVVHLQQHDKSHFKTFDLTVNQSGKVYMKKVHKIRVTGEVQKQHI